MSKIIIAALFSLALLVGCTTPLPEGVYMSPYIGVSKSPKEPSQAKPAPVEEAEEE